MCNKCGTYNANMLGISAEQRAKQARNAETATWIAVGATILTNNIGALINGVEESSSDYIPRSRRNDDNIDDSSNDIKAQEKTVKDLIGETNFNNLSEDFKGEVLKKYSTISTYAKNNNITISDEEMTRRLNNYIKALDAHKKELQMGDYQLQLLETDENEGKAGLENCPVTIVDNDIIQGKAGSDEEYYQSFLARGEGYVELYDTNGDGVVELDEFLSKEESDAGSSEISEEDEAAFNMLAGDDKKLSLNEYLNNIKVQLKRDLSDDEIQRHTNEYNIIAGTDNAIDYNEYIKSEEIFAKNYFSTIAGDNKIDAKEMASHLYAVSRLYDGDTKSTGEDITFKEWYGAQSIGTDANITNNYDFWKNKFGNDFKQFLDD